MEKGPIAGPLATKKGRYEKAADVRPWAFRNPRSACRKRGIGLKMFTGRKRD